METRSIFRPAPVDPQRVLTSFTRGKTRPKGVTWFGITDFWGHLRHFLASAIATEDVDSRDWMWADMPDDLCDRIALRLGASGTGKTLSERMDGPVWVDYISDTGDDSSVSSRVAELVFAEYELPDPERSGEFLVAPRGDILVFGGDTAYPVATVDEIHNRVVVPFNRVLERVDDGRPRALLGIPGNHDWYDGLDGFARMFRRPADEASPTVRPSFLKVQSPPLEKAAKWAREFVAGGQIDKPKALTLLGYEALQRASYFALPLTPEVLVFAVDRQLKRIDFRQRSYFSEHWRRMPQSSCLLFLPDPVRAFGRPSRTGTRMIEDLPIDTSRNSCLVVSGDIHHYERWQEGDTTHVIAGGGGAFLHPQLMTSCEQTASSVLWPNPKQCRALLSKVPWKVLVGRSGVLPHLILAALFLPAVESLLARDESRALLATVLAGIPLWVIFAFLGGVRQSSSTKRVLLWAGVFAWAIAFLPVILTLVLFPWLNLVSSFWVTVVAVTLAVLGGAYGFGLFLSLMTRFGLEHTQAFTALDHPGFKHFLRMRVRPDGEAIDVYCIGLSDPLGDDSKPELVDHFIYRPARRQRR